MLLAINFLDINNIFINSILPKGISLSDFVHQAVWSSIFSIIVAVGLIMWFFKGDLNFNKHSKLIKALVYIWVLQSVLMLLSTIIRNSWYIHQYQLTYLRIGVYVFLVLSLIGLFFTALKIFKTKSAWYLVCKNFEAWLLILVVCSCFNWDRIITRYNISNATDVKNIDIVYLIELSEANIPELVNLYNNPKTNYIFTKSNYRYNSSKDLFLSKINNYII